MMSNNPISLDEAIKKASEKFLYCEESVSAIHLAYQTGRNAILHGPGGYGKTKISEFLGKLLFPPEQIETVPFGEFTITANVLGGLDMKAMQDDGDILFKPERSFMARNFIIFEEFLDAQGQVLENLKYILSEGKFPQRGGEYKTNNWCIIGCTNRDPLTWAKDNASLSALMSRFPYDQKVVWPRHDYEDYQELFRKQLGKEIPEVAEACALAHEHKTTLSPRTALHFAKAYESRGTLGVFAFERNVQNNRSLLQAILQVEGKAKYRATVRKSLAMVKERLKEIGTITQATANTQLAKLQYLNKTVRGFRVDDKLAEETTDILAQINQALQTADKLATPVVDQNFLIPTT